MYEKVTRDISVSVRSFYLEEQSSPDEDHFVWAYKVNIQNRGQDTVQLLNRHWKITDKFGRLQEHKGAGVVGEQPVLKPGESFEYTSWTRLATPHGSMQGTFFCMTEDAHAFDAPVPEFALVFPGALH